MRRNSGPPCWRFLAGIVLALALTAPPPSEAKTGDAKAKIEVDGAGPIRNRELRLALQRLLQTNTRPTVDANAIEDAAVILSSSMGEEGFQKPEIEIVATLADGTRKEMTFDPTFASPLPRPLEAREVRFKLKPGVRYHVREVTFKGLGAISEKEARAFYRSSSTLIAVSATNAYSPSRVNRSTEALLDALRRRGYAEAEVKAPTEENPKTGDVTVRVEVKLGPRWMVRDVAYQRDPEDKVELSKPELWAKVLGKKGLEAAPWTATLQEDIREAVRQAYYKAGYPDVGVHVAAEAVAAPDGHKDADVAITIVPGSQVKVGEVKFEGRNVTRESVLRRRVRAQVGEPLNLVEMERARYRISRLGVFDAVDLRYAPEDGEQRDAIFTLREGPRYETNLLMGYGSYEQVRAGVEHRQMNIFGLAHQSRLELVQSMKSTSGDYAYTVPELFGESLDGTAQLFGLRRREIAFVRKEFGVNLSLKRSIRAIAGEATAGYTFQALAAGRNSLSTRASDQQQINVASINAGLTSDRRDNPIRPRHGYHASVQVEAADPKFGGQATYQRFEFTSAYHTGWGDGRWIHVGLSHGVITTFGADGDRGLPVNKRFYPGGDNSIRGYLRGEAAPRGPDGFIGAKSYVLGNLELEQALTPNWSVVAFGDALGTAVSLRGYPLKEKLYSAGLGVRYQTLIGPLRLEYARNINPRPADPPGTWQISIGYPF